MQAACRHLPLEASPEIQASVLDFIVERLRNLLLDSGGRHDVVAAVLAAQGHNPARAAKAVEALSAWTERPDWDRILPAFARCVRITRDLEGRLPLDPDALVEPAAKALFIALQQAEKATRAPGSVDNFLQAFTPLIPVIDTFFDEVLVMDKDEDLRNNRLALLQRIGDLAGGVADMSHLEGF